MVNYGKMLSIAMLVLSAFACIAYFLQKDYRKAVYWLGSTILIGSLTF